MNIRRATMEDLPGIRALKQPDNTMKSPLQRWSFFSLFAIALACPVSMPPPCACAQQAEADRQALAQLRAQAERGDAESQFEMGQAFSRGTFGLRTNCVEAAKWWRQAAGQNHAVAQHNLGVCYRDGLGVATNYVEAYKWYLQAAAQGDAKATRSASMLELMLSQQEVAEGKRRAQIEATSSTMRE